MPSTSLRPQIVRVMAAHRERPLTTEESMSKSPPPGWPASTLSRTAIATW